MPTGHLAGKDNGPGEGNHHPGEDCGICHAPGGRGGLWMLDNSTQRHRGAVGKISRYHPT